MKKTKCSNYKAHPHKKRIDYVYDNYCSDKTITINDFIIQVNKAYYMYAAGEYKITANDKIINNYKDFFKNIPSGYDIFDIGGGTGFPYFCIKDDINYKYNQYHIIEPSKYMTKDLPSSDDKLIILNKDVSSCWETLEKNTKKIILMNATLHHIIYLDTFFEKIRSVMNDEDYFFFAQEPNNGWYNSILFWVDSVIEVKKTTRRLLVNLCEKLGLKSYLKTKFTKKNTTNIKPTGLEASLQELRKQNIVNTSFTKDLIYAITDYGVFTNWRYISIPDEYNEGFYESSFISKSLGMNPFYINTHRPLLIPYTKGVRGMLSKILQKMFPEKCYMFSLGYRK